MRLIARLPNEEQVGALVDSLKNIGFDRKDMIISDLSREKNYRTPIDAADEMTFVKTERNGMGEIDTFASGVEGLKGHSGIVVAVEMPKHSGPKVRNVMEQYGAVEIIQD